MATDLRLIGSNLKYERWRWQIFFITWLAYAGFYLTRKSFSVAKIELMKPGAGTHGVGGVWGFWCSNSARGGWVASVRAGVGAQRLGWRVAFWVPGGVLFIIGLLFLLPQRNRPEDGGLSPIEQYPGGPEAVVEDDETPAE